MQYHCLMVQLINFKNAWLKQKTITYSIKGIRRSIVPLRGDIKGMAFCFPKGDSIIGKKNIAYFQLM